MPACSADGPFSCHTIATRSCSPVVALPASQWQHGTAILSPTARRASSPRRRNMSKKTILVTGAGSGFGKGAAIGMAKNGHNVIATVQVSPQVMPLREKAKQLGLDNLRVERLDLADPYDIAQAQSWDFDVLWNNAGQGEAGPVWEIPVVLVRRNYEINVFLPLVLTQGVVQKWVANKKKGKV